MNESNLTPSLQEEPAEDAGTQTASRYFFQYQCAARHCFSLLTQTDLESVICEWHTDFILSYIDGRNELISVKHREPHLGPWPFVDLWDKGGLRTLYARWKDSPQARCRLVTNGALKTGKDRAKSFTQACLTASDAEVSRFSGEVAQKLQCDEQTARAFLKSLTIEHSLPDRSAIRPFYIVNLVEKSLQAAGISGVAPRVAWDSVVALVAQFSRDFDHREFSSLDFTRAHSLSAESLRREKIDRRTIRRDSVINAIRNPDSHTEVNRVPQVSNLWVREPVESFVGRDQEVHTVQDQLAAPDKQSVIAVLGMSGVGKSELITQYAWTQAEHYSFVWSLRGESMELALKDLSDFAERVGLPNPTTAEAMQTIKEYFRRATGLILLDNAPAETEIFDLIPRGAKTHFLISSLDQRWAAHYPSIQLTPLQERDSLNLLQSLLPFLAPVDVDMLSRALGGLPLAIRQAAGYITVSGIDPVGYAQLLMSRASELLKRSAPREHVGLAATWGITAGYLREVHPSAYRLLQLLSMLAARSFPLELFRVELKFLGGEENSDDERRNQQHAIDAAAEEELRQFDEECLRLLAEFKDPLHLHDCVADLQKFSLIDMQPTGVSCHSLTQELVRQSMSDEAESIGLQCIVYLLHKVSRLDPQDSQFWPHYEVMMPHFDVAIERIHGKRGLTVNLLMFYCVLALNLNAVGMHQLAVRYAEEALSLTQKEAGDLHRQVFSALCLTESLTALGRFDEAMALARNYLTKCQGKSAFDLAICDLRNKIAAIFYWQGDLKSAAAELAIIEDVIPVAGSSGVERAVKASRANLRREMGDAAGAISDLRDLVADYPEAASRNELATFHCNLALAYLDAGNPREALVSSMKAIQLDVEYSGGLHGNCARDWNNSGLAWLELGMAEDASRAFEEALRIHDEIGDTSSMRRLIVQVNLGRALMAEGDHAEARKVIEDALAQQEMIFGKHHRDVAGTLTNLAVLYSHMGMTADAAKVARRALSIDLSVYGDDHPELIADYTNLAGPLILLGQYNAAEKWLGKAYKIAVDRFGPRHFKTAYCRSQISLCLYRKGDIVGGIRGMESVIQIFEDSFGSAHPEAKNCRAVLELMRSRRL
ncbi:dsDNA nuclease domain-containing protein [Streptomyces sp. NPDC005480]|uniref:dsDNA nuclease domain-containing protein n=1 Tax=Streptomyces sp. NPDC005480 TaxID=3154880 RepID=UPI0033AC2D3D